MALPAVTVADHAEVAGFKGDALVTMVAVAWGESQLNPAAEGDVGIQTAVWGPSIGLCQIRSVKAERGKGTSRDADRLKDPAFNLRAAYTISNGGASFRPWSVYTSGAYRAYLSRAAAAVAGVEASGGPSTSPAGMGPSSASGGTPAPFRLSPAPGVAAVGEKVLTPDRGAQPVTELLARRRPPAPIEGLTVAGMDAAPIPVSAKVTAGSVSFSADAVSEIEFTVDDEGAHLGALLTLRALVAWPPWAGEVAAYGVEPNAGGILGWKLATRSRGAQRLRHEGQLPAGALPPNPGAPPPVPAGLSAKNVSATEYAVMAALAADLELTAKGTAKRPDIVPEELTGQGRSESTWEVLDRLATEEGYWFFEAAGRLYFAPPSWLQDNMPTVTVTVGTGDTSTDVVGLPRPRTSIDGDDGATLALDLPRWRGERVRPGMVLVVTWPTWLGGWPKRWLVRRVSWSIEDVDGVVSIDAVEPIDPVPGLELAEDVAGVDAGAAGAGPAVETAAGPSTLGPVAASGFRWPMQGKITSRFGDPRPGRLHMGVDIAGPQGTPVIASHAGRVAVAGTQQGYGSVIYLEGANGDETRYGHLSKMLVVVGEAVASGQLIGHCGNTGVSSGPHLHFEIRPLGKAAVDPLKVLGSSTPGGGSSSQDG